MKRVFLIEECLRKIENNEESMCIFFQITVSPFFQHFLKFIFVRKYFKKGILGAFKYLACTFHLFVKKGFLCSRIAAILIE